MPLYPVYLLKKLFSTKLPLHEVACLTARNRIADRIPLVIVIAIYIISHERCVTTFDLVSADSVQHGRFYAAVVAITLDYLSERIYIK